MKHTAIQRSWNRAYYLVLAVWILLVPALTFLADVTLAPVFISPHFSGLEDAYPLITAGYHTLGTFGLYGISGIHGTVILLCAPFRNRLLAVVLAAIALLSSVYFATFGIIAAYLAYVKLCVYC